MVPEGPKSTTAWKGCQKAGRGLVTFHLQHRKLRGRTGKWAKVINPQSPVLTIFLQQSPPPNSATYWDHMFKHSSLWRTLPI